MEMTDKNNGYYLGYKDGISAVFINENNYEKKSVFVFSSISNTWNEFPEKLDYKGYKVEKPKKGIIVKDSGMMESYLDEMKDFTEVVSLRKKPEFMFGDEKILLEVYMQRKKAPKMGFV